MCLYGLVNKLVATQLLKADSLKANCSYTNISLLSLMNPCYICWVRHVLMLALLFKSLEKSQMGTRLLEFRGIRLVINQSVVPMDLESSPEDRSCLSAVYTLRLYFFILIHYVSKHCLLILPLFVAICEIWLPELTYGVYLVLFLKLCATIGICIMKINLWSIWCWSFYVCIT